MALQFPVAARRAGFGVKFEHALRLVGHHQDIQVARFDLRLAQGFFQRGVLAGMGGAHPFVAQLSRQKAAGGGWLRPRRAAGDQEQDGDNANAEAEADPSCRTIRHCLLPEGH